jgi:putative transposase
MFSSAAIQTLRRARKVIKEMKLYDIDHSEDMRTQARHALQDIIEGRMEALIDDALKEMDSQGILDRRNGTYPRNFLSELGNLELCVPRTRRVSACAVLQKYARRTAQIDQVILAGFVLGLSTRKVGQTLLALLGEKISASTVSQVAKTLDRSVACFHNRPLANIYKVLLLDGVVLSRKTGAGAEKRPVLVALGIREDGRKEIIDYQLSGSESQAEWEQFLGDLYKRGLTGESLAAITVDGGKGLLAALPFVYGKVRVQRCVVHKTRNLQNKCRKADWPAMKRGLHRIFEATTEVQARHAARRFANRWEQSYPEVVKSLRQDLDALLQFFIFKDAVWRKATRSTNAIERRFREVRRRTRPMGVFSNRTSMERILFAVFINENKSQGVDTPFLMLTHNN